MKTSTIYYRITHSEGDFYQSESLDEMMSWIPKSYKKTDDVSKCNHLTWHFEKFEQIIDEDDNDDVNLIDECYYIGRYKK
jgi:hypothetical protein